MRLSQEKGVVDDADFVNMATKVQRITKRPIYPPTSFAMFEVGTSHCLIPSMENAILETYPLPAPMPFEGVYTYIPTCLLQ